MDGRNLDRRALTNAAMIQAGNPVRQLQTDVDYLFESELFSIGDGKDSIVDSKNISSKVKECLEMMIGSDTHCATKIKIADFICNRLHGLYRLSANKTQILIKHLTCAIYNGTTLTVPLRLHYLRFQNDYVAYSTSVRLFLKGIRENLRMVPYFQILKYILRAGIDLRNESHNEAVLEEFETMFANKYVSIYTKMEIADIFILNRQIERGHEMLDELRQVEYAMQHLEHDSTIYGDTQNVHTQAINDSVLKACVRLMEIEPPVGFDPDSVREKLCQISPDHIVDISTVIERVEIDTSRFKSGETLFGLYDVFSSLWAYIGKHKHSESLCLRLIEEVASMSRFCSTGHVSRFINVIQGFTEDDSLAVHISNEQQVKAVLSSYLGKELAKADETIVDNMVAAEPTLFYGFVQDRVNQFLPHLVDSYGATHIEVIEAVKSYSRWDKWDIIESKIVRLKE